MRVMGQRKGAIISTVGTYQNLVGVVVADGDSDYSLDYLYPMDQHFDNDGFVGDCRVDKLCVALVVVDFDFDFDTLSVVHDHKLVSADCCVGQRCCDIVGMWIVLGLHCDQSWVEMG